MYLPVLMGQPPILPCRLQQSTFGRIGLNRRVRYGNGCFSVTYRHPNVASRFALTPLPHKSLICGGPLQVILRAPLSALDRPTAMHSLTLPLFRKEVIQPHLPIRLPCYDFTPVTGSAFDGSYLAVRPPASGISDSHGVTGGVYKTRERIHRDILIRDY